MKSIFEPLLHANARAFAVLGGLAFLAMVAWSGYAEYSAARQARLDAEESQRRGEAFLPEFPAIEPLGILAYVDSQTAPGTEANHLPVDLFRPPVDDQGNPVRPGTTLHLQKPDEGGNTGDEQVPEEVAKLLDQAASQQGGGGTGGRPGGGRWQGPGGRRPGTPGTAGKPDRTLRYAGVFKRSDGTLAAWIADSDGGGSFVTPGATVAGATILDQGDTDRVRIHLPDGSEAVLKRGGEPVVVEQGTPAQPAVGDGGNGQGGGNDQGAGKRQRRLPTEEEIAEIEKRDPELARRIREAMQRRRKD